MKKLFWIFLAVGLLLGWLGQKPVESPYIGLGQFISVLYFSIILIGFPMVGKLESMLLRQS